MYYSLVVASASSMAVLGRAEAVVQETLAARRRVVSEVRRMVVSEVRQAREMRMSISGTVRRGSGAQVMVAGDSAWMREG